MCASAGAQLVAFSPVLRTLKLTGRVPEEFLVVLLAFVKLQYNLYRLSQLHRVSVVDVSAFGSPKHMILPGRRSLLQHPQDSAGRPSSPCVAPGQDRPARSRLLRDNVRLTFETLEVSQELYTLLRRSPKSAVAWHFFKLLLRNKHEEIGAKFVFPEGRSVQSFKEVD